MTNVEAKATEMHATLIKRCDEMIKDYNLPPEFHKLFKLAYLEGAKAALTMTLGLIP
jgi:hypothetical protein